MCGPTSKRYCLLTPNATKRCELRGQVMVRCVARLVAVMSGILIALVQHPALGQPGPDEAGSATTLSSLWCLDVSGCSHWWSRFTVEINRPRKRITIAYRNEASNKPDQIDASLVIFQGVLDENMNMQWSITGKVNPGQANESELAKSGAEVTELIPSKLLPIAIKKGEIKKGGATSNFTGTVEDAVVGGISITGNISGKVKTASGEETVSGPFAGVLQGTKGKALTGVYTPPPYKKCEPEDTGIKTVAAEVAPPAKKDAPVVIRIGVPLSPEERKARDKGEQFVSTRSLDPPRRKYSRDVTGTFDDARITLTLPPMPILDDRCLVKAVSPGGKLTLERYDAPHRPSRSAAGDLAER